MSIQYFLESILYFINDTLIPLIIALAFLFFVWNIARYFIIGGHSDENREKAKRMAFWGILAFVFIVGIWSITNLLVSGLGFDREDPLSPDYIESGGGGQFNTRGEVECRDVIGGFVWCRSD